VVTDYRAVFRSALYEKNPLMRFVLLHIANQQKPHSGCFMSADEIAAGLGISRSTVQRAMKIAHVDGVLRTESFRNHKGHKVSQRWVITERFEATERKSLASLDDAKTMRHPEPSPSVTDNKAKRQTDTSLASSDDALLRKTLIIKNNIEKNKIGNSPDSALIEKITIAGRKFSRAEWEEVRKKYTSFGSNIAQIYFANGSADYALIGWDGYQYVLRARLGGAVLV
jgi:biotin operon repressor